MISAIVAVDENWGIGSNNKLLARIPEDMKNFKEKTTHNIHNVVIMGRKTYDSLQQKPLPNRTNIVITSKKIDSSYTNEDKTMFVSMDFIKAYLSTLPSSPEYPVDYYVIGGGMIYKELLPYCEKAYVTKIYHAYDDVDTYFPNIDNVSEWEIKDVSEMKEYKDIKYQFYTYEKRVQE